jgi:ferredoxin
MPISKVWIEPGCIVCNLSADTCPAVFEVPPGSDTAIVKPGVDLSRHEAQIREAAEGCPVSVIKFDEA